MLELLCVIVGVTEWAFSVEVDETKSVDNLKGVIKNAKRNALTGINASDLQLFTAKTTDGKWLESNDPDVIKTTSGDIPEQVKKFLKDGIDPAKDIANVFQDAPTTMTIHVLVVAPNQVRTPTWPWTLATKPCPVLNFLDNDSVIHIPEEYAQGSGLVVDKDGLYLYLRPELKKQWAALHDNVVKTYAAQWIVGPPGTGKSCAAFAFACSLKRDGDWDILWIHCSKDVVLGNSLFCILFRGDSDKRTCVVGRSQLSSLLLSLQKNAVLFLDGYVKAQHELSVLEACGLWHLANKQCHRVVVVTSMVSLGKDFRPDRYAKIQSTTESSLESLAISRPTVSEETSSKINDQQQFMLPSWTWEDYEQALANDVFFEHVRSKFTDSDGDIKLEERYELLKAKFFVAGGCACMMFGMSSEEAMDLLRWAIPAARNITQYVDSSMGVYSDSVVNQVLSWYGDPPVNARLVSEFVAREFAFTLGLQKLLCLVGHPVINGYAFKMWFFAALIHGGVHCHFYQGGQLKEVVWKAENAFKSVISDLNAISSSICPVKRFDPRGVLPLNHREQWLAPISWKQGGYDAVYIESLELTTDEADIKASKAGFTQKMLVRFVQVTCSTTRSFKVRFFKDLLTRLFNESVWLDVVEVCFVVPVENMAEFHVPTNDNDFKREALTAFGSDFPTSISIQVLGLNYVLNDEVGTVSVGQKRKRNS